MTVPPTTPPSPGKKILVARFDAADGAKQALDRLKNSGARLGNAGLIEREADGGVKFTETKDWGIGKSAAVGALAALILPGIGLVMGGVAGGLAAYFIDAGFPDPLLRQLGTSLEAGDSMIVVLVQEDDVVPAERAVVEAGGVVLGSGLDPDLASAIDKLRGSGSGAG